MNIQRESFERLVEDRVMRTSEMFKLLTKLVGGATELSRDEVEDVISHLDEQWDRTKEILRVTPVQVEWKLSEVPLVDIDKDILLRKMEIS